MGRATKAEAGYIKVPKELWAPCGRGVRCGTCYFFGERETQHTNLRDIEDVVSGCGKVKGGIHSQDCCNYFSIDGKISNKFLSGKESKKVFKEKE